MPADHTWTYQYRVGSRNERDQRFGRVEGEVARPDLGQAHHAGFGEAQANL